MKRAGWLLPRIVDRANVAAAFRQAARGKARRPEVISFRRRLSVHLAEISRGLLAGDFPFGAYHRFVIRDPKRRVIHAAPFPERVAHHALMNVAGPHLERGAIDQSFACREGRGNRAALQLARRHTAGARHFLKLDIRGYFDSIDHNVLLGSLERIFKDRPLLDLFERAVASYHRDPGKGLPIGALTSQYFANHYLDRFDHWVKSDLRSRRYVRFMDDFVLWHDEEAQLRDWHERIEQWLQDKLRLRIKPAQFGRSAQGLPFLGFRVLPHCLLPARRSRRRFRRRLAEALRQHAEGWISESDLQRRAEALTSFVRTGSGRAWRRRCVGDLEGWK